MMVLIFLVFYFYSKKLHIGNKKILEQKEHLNDGLLEFQENYFQTIQFKVKKMMKNKWDISMITILWMFIIMMK